MKRRLFQEGKSRNRKALKLRLKQRSVSFCFKAQSSVMTWPMPETLVSWGGTRSEGQGEIKTPLSEERNTVIAHAEVRRFLRLPSHQMSITKMEQRKSMRYEQLQNRVERKHMWISAVLSQTWIRALSFRSLSSSFSLAGTVRRNDERMFLFERRIDLEFSTIFGFLS